MCPFSANQVFSPSACRIACAVRRPPANFILDRLQRPAKAVRILAREEGLDIRHHRRVGKLFQRAADKSVEHDRVAQLGAARGPVLLHEGPLQGPGGRVGAERCAGRDRVRGRRRRRRVEEEGDENVLDEAGVAHVAEGDQADFLAVNSTVGVVCHSFLRTSTDLAGSIVTATR